MENTDAADDDDHLRVLLLIPGDVLIQILVWLPVISLLRFKSVCKSWLSLIESSFFIHLHATMLPSSSSSRFGTFIFQTSPNNCLYNITETTEIFMLSSSSSSRSGGGGGGGGEDDEDEEVVLEVEDLGLPPLNYNLVPITLQDLFMVGSCNGIVCLYDLAFGDISLWNPATRQFRLLPKSSLTFEEEEEEEEDSLDDYEDHHEFVVGFGFDVITKDYKVVQITFCEERTLGVQVYSLSTDSWRLLEGGGRGLNPLFAKQVRELNIDHGLYLNGSYFFEGIYHHQGDQIGHSMMLSFDFTQEIFTTMQFPDECDPNSTLIVITCLGDKMALFTKVESSSTTDDYDIWVLNEHHGSSSSSSVNKEEESSYWTKLQQHSFRMKNNSHWTIPRGISNNGEFAFIETRGLGRRSLSASSSSSSNGAKGWKLQLFNLVTKELAKIEFPIGRELGRAHVYKPSLVSIIGGGNGAAAAAAANRVIGDAI